MKKLLSLILILIIANLTLLVLITVRVREFAVEGGLIDKCDTMINKVRIDSIEYVIKSKDSIITKIKNDEKEYSEKVNQLSDTASVELFKRLVSE